MQQQPAYSRQTIDMLAQSIDEAVELLRRGRYPELDEHFRGFAQRAQQLEGLKRALENGSPAPPGMQQSCERLGRRLIVFAEVARQVVTIESGMMQLLAAPRDSSYGRDGQCGNRGGYQFEQEA